MYAVRGNSPVFHLVISGGKQTVCGLSITGLVLQHPTGPALHLTQHKPDYALLCKHCARLSESMTDSDTD